MRWGADTANIPEKETISFWNPVSLCPSRFKWIFFLFKKKEEITYRTFHGSGFGWMKGGAGKEGSDVSFRWKEYHIGYFLGSVVMYICCIRILYLNSHISSYFLFCFCSSRYISYIIIISCLSLPFFLAVFCPLSVASWSKEILDISSLLSYSTSASPLPPDTLNSHKIDCLVNGYVFLPWVWRTSKISLWCLHSSPQLSTEEIVVRP